MKFIKFVFTCFWLLIILAIANAIAVSSGNKLAASHTGMVNLVVFVALFITWFSFPYTIAPVLRITESPFKLFTMRCASAFAMALFGLGVVGHFSGGLS